MLTAKIATDAHIAVNLRLAQTEIVGGLRRRFPAGDQMQVGRVNVAVRIGASRGEANESARDGGFTGAALAAEDQ